MKKAVTILALLLIVAINFQNALSSCNCDDLCEGKKAYERVKCTKDEVTEPKTVNVLSASRFPGLIGNKRETETENDECKTYCECSAPKKGKPFPCPLPFAFDPESQSCTWKNDVDGCSGDNEIDDPDCTHDDCDEEEFWDAMIEQCVPHSTYVCGKEVAPDCTQPEYDRLFVADKENCAGYYYCEDRKRFRGECNSNLYHFDPKNQRCALKSGLPCKVISSSGSSSSSDIDLNGICKGKVGLFVADPRVCTAYFYCMTADFPFQGFCADDRYFDNGICSKTPPKSCNCETIDWSKITGELQVAYAAHPDENKYFQCSRAGERSLKSCFSGTVWSQKDQSCVKK